MTAFRYWRIYTTDNNNSWKSIQISEVQWRTASGGAKTNPVVTTGDKQYTTNAPSNVNDGNFSTCFASDGSLGVPVGLYFDFGADMSFAEIAIAPNAGVPYYAPKNFTIDGSPDNATWTNVATFSNIPQGAYADNQLTVFELVAQTGNEISKAGMVGVMRVPDGSLIVKAGMVGVMRVPPGSLIVKAGMVAVMRQKVLHDSNRRRPGMVPIF